MSKQSLASVFVDEACRVLDFLVADCGFVGRETAENLDVGGAWVSYYSPSLHVESTLEPREGVTTRVRLAENSQGWADVLVVAGAAKVPIPTGSFARASSLHGLRAALRAQGEALRLVLPLLQRANAPELMARARAH